MFTMTTTRTARIDAGYDRNGRPAHVTMRIRLDEATDHYAAKAEADAFVAATFPKSAKVRGTSLSTFEGKPGADDYRNFVCGLVIFDADLASNGVNGGINETGLRRYRAMRKALAAAGIETEWAAGGYVSSYATEADFHAAAGL